MGIRDGGNAIRDNKEETIDEGYEIREQRKE
jgi:hypothetical protein